MFYLLTYFIVHVADGTMQLLVMGITVLTAGTSKMWCVYSDINQEVKTLKLCNTTTTARVFSNSESSKTVNFSNKNSD